MKAFVAIAFVLAVCLASSTFAKPQTGASRSAPKQAFTYANVVAYFKSAQLHPTEVQKRCTIFFEGEWKNANIYDYCVIMVESSDEDLQVTFYLTDAHEMNWITEFLDAPFFAQAETEKLFELMNSDRGVRAEKVGRFRVDFHRWEPRHAQIFVFSFTRTGTRG